MDDLAWYEHEDPDECARAVVALCRELQGTEGERHRARWFECWRRYDGRRFEDCSMAGAWDEDNRYNVSRSAVDTAQAEIAARQRPKPMFLTSGADWQTRRRAKKMDRVVEAQFHQRQGARYADVWELAEDCFRDASIDVGGVVKVSIDYPNERLRYSRVPAYEILVDPVEAEGGDPQSWFHTYPMSVGEAIATFVDDAPDEGGETPAQPKDEDAPKLEAELIRARILNSVTSSRVDSGHSGVRMRVTRSLQVYEAWWLPPSAEEPGRHIYACAEGILHDEEWRWPCPPLAVIVWSHEAYGIWGTGLVQAGAVQHDEIQELAEANNYRFKHCSQQIVDYIPGSVAPDVLASNDHIIFRAINGGDLSKAPRVQNIPPLTPAETQELDSRIRRYYDLQGVSQMSAASRKEPGVDSGVAIQTLGDMKAVRFLPKSRAYEMLFARLGEITVHALSDLARTAKVVARWPGAKEIVEIPWEKASLEETMYTVRVAPVSAMSRDPAQRLQIIEQLAGLGFLPKEKYFQLLEMPDLDAALETETGEQRWIEKMVDRYLDAEDDEDLDELGGFVEPDGYLMNPPGALALVGQHYFDAMVNDAPIFNADLLRRFMSSLSRIIQRSMPKPQAQLPAAGVAPVAAGQVAMPQGMAA